MVTIQQEYITAADNALFLFFQNNSNTITMEVQYADVDLSVHQCLQHCGETVSNNIMLLLITVVFGGVLRVGGGVWERARSMHVMNSVSPESVCFNFCKSTSCWELARKRRASLCDDGFEVIT